MTLSGKIFWNLHLLRISAFNYRFYLSSNFNRNLDGPQLYLRDKSNYRKDRQLIESSKFTNVCRAIESIVYIRRGCMGTFITQLIRVKIQLIILILLLIILAFCLIEMFWAYFLDCTLFHVSSFCSNLFSKSNACKF